MSNFLVNIIKEDNLLILKNDKGVDTFGGYAIHFNKEDLCKLDMSYNEDTRILISREYKRSFNITKEILDVLLEKGRHSLDLELDV